LFFSIPVREFFIVGATEMSADIPLNSPFRLRFYAEQSFDGHKMWSRLEFDGGDVFPKIV
jgi:hypothetical protein